jgi:WD40 repeat protein
MLAPDTLLQERYLVLRPIGRGGMGTVYEAIDQRLHATVALKETLLTDKVSRRAFRREAQLLARLRHPALPKVIDHFDEGEGQFLVMEFIPGDDLAALMEKRGGKFPVSAVTPWVLRWADQLLDALDYLHNQAPPVIHRDIKPQNLKLSARGDIILLDFGLAKGGMTDATVTARGDKVLGFTPNYAPLEQIRGGEPDVRSDIYSLGATLYHLLTGAKPPDALTRIAALLNDQKDPLHPANERNEHVPTMVAAVIDKALAANQRDRFASAADMRRALYHAHAQGQRQRDWGPRTAKLAQSTERMDTGSGNTSNPSGDTSQPPPPPTGPANTFAGQNDSDSDITRRDITTTSRLSSITQVSVRDPNAPPVGTLLETIPTGCAVLCMALSPDERLVATGGEDHLINLWDVESTELERMLKGHTRGVSSLAFNPQGNLLASVSEDKTMRLWRVSDGSLLFVSPEQADALETVAFSPDGSWLAVGGWNGAVLLYGVDNEQLAEPIELPTGFVHSVSFSPNSELLAAGCYDTTIRLWRVQDRRPVHTLSEDKNFVLTTTFSPNGKRLASGGGSRDVKIWRLADGRLLDTLNGHTNFVRTLAFSPNSKILASGSEDKTVRLWRVNDGSAIAELDGHGDGVTSVVFTQDGQIVVTASRDSKVRFWQAN